MKIHPRNISIDNYDYPLSDDKIARYPKQQRDQSKLLVFKNGLISEELFNNLSTHLPNDSLIIFNETKVIHARLFFQKESGSRIEVFCLEPANAIDTQLAFQQKGSCTWRCLIGNAKRWKNGPLKLIVGGADHPITLSVEKLEKLDDTFVVRFDWNPETLTFSEILETAGHMPLPPYLGREDLPEDAISYQTMFAKNDGSVAAPTAGLHFTPEVLESLKNRGIETTKITLHVGAGTFKPVSSDLLDGHHMHTEQVLIPLEVIEKLLNHLGKPIILVGTTTVRAIESIYWQGVKWLLAEPENPIMDVKQWDPYKQELNTDISLEEALYCVYQVVLRHNCKFLRGTTSLLIAPGYKYRFPDAIITNFHQPKSTLLLLVSAFIGQDWRKAYDYALENDFRFLSYGDSCLFFKKD